MALYFPLARLHGNAYTIIARATTKSSPNDPRTTGNSSRGAEGAIEEIVRQSLHKYRETEGEREREREREREKEKEREREREPK